MRKLANISKLYSSSKMFNFHGCKKRFWMKGEYRVIRTEIILLEHFEEKVKNIWKQ